MEQLFEIGQQTISQAQQLIDKAIQVCFSLYHSRRYRSLESVVQTRTLEIHARWADSPTDTKSSSPPPDSPMSPPMTPMSSTFLSTIALPPLQHATLEGFDDVHDEPVLERLLTRRIDKRIATIIDADEKVRLWLNVVKDVLRNTKRNLL